MTFIQGCALTYDGVLDVETNVPLEQLEVGDRVLGLPDVFHPDQPRTVYTVTAKLGEYHIPTEDPTLFERLLARLGVEHMFAGAKVPGILVQGSHSRALFAVDDTPVLDRVIL